MGRKLKTEPQDTPASLPTTCTNLQMPRVRVKMCARCAFPEVLLGGRREAEGRFLGSLTVTEDPELRVLALGTVAGQTRD